MRSTLAFMLALGLVVTGCKSSGNGQAPAASPSAEPECQNRVETAANTGVAGAKTGVTTAAAGIVQAGSAAAGLVHGGTDEAKKNWREGGSETKSTANKGADETSREAHVPRCK